MLTPASHFMKTTIIIPARYHSTRLPGKPLVKIAGKTMLERVVGLAREGTQQFKDVAIYVATDDGRVGAHCDEIKVPWLMTPATCRTGTDRAEAAVIQLPEAPDFVLNVQGDAPLTPPHFIAAMVESFAKAPVDVITPVTQLTWAQLDELREHKKATPFSGTCAVFHPDTGKAFWFSKTIIPTMRNEEQLRNQGPISPVYRHIGLYGYRRAMLSQFVKLPEGRLEALEGLEQLRVLENGYSIRCVPVDYRGRPSMSGVDSPEDVKRAEQLVGQN